MNKSQNAELARLAQLTELVQLGSVHFTTYLVTRCSELVQRGRNFVSFILGRYDAVDV